MATFPFPFPLLLLLPLQPRQLDQLLAFFSNDNFLTYGLPSPAAAAAHSPAVREESMRRRSVLKDNMLSLFRSPSAAASTNTAASRKRVTIVEPSPASPIAASSLAHTPSSSAAITPSRPAPPRPTLQVTTSTTPLHTGSNVRPAVYVHLVLAGSVNCLSFLTLLILFFDSNPRIGN